MNPYLTGMLLLVIAVLQTTAMPLFSLWGVRPELLLLVIASWSVLAGMDSGLVWALGGGLMLDALSGGPFGAATIALTIASVIVSLAEVNLQRDSIWLPLITGLLATVLYQGMYLLALRVLGRPTPLIPGLVHVVLPSLVVNGLAAYPVFGATRWLHQRVVRERLQW